MTLVEICIDDPGGERAAEEGGAGRIELCAVVAVGGVTPSIGAVEAALAGCSLPVQVLVRPRPGDFVHDDAELALMVRDIARLRDLAGDHPGRLGVTTGALTPECHVDTDAVRRLVDAAGPLHTTFHRGFDECPDLLAALEDLAHCGVARVLTAGGPGPAREHLPTLRALVEASAGRVGILAGGGVRADHVAELVAQTGVTEVHLRAQGPGRPHEGILRTDAELVRATVAALGPPRTAS